MNARQIKLELARVFGHQEWGILTPAAQQLVAEDFIDAKVEDGCSVEEYRQRIGAGNLYAYVSSLKGMPHMQGYPHEGGCARCRALRVCSACGEDLIPGQRCTNGRCLHCHAMICEPGGSVTSGHGFGNAKLRRLT